MSNSPLISCTMLSPNKSSPRNHTIDTITIHCVVGQLSAESIGNCFKNKKRQASCNYGIGTDGRIVLVVDENDRSWCSSNAANDNRAITIECASERYAPYAINDKVYASLIRLCADICKRNNIKSLKWKGDKKLIGKVDQQNMTVHSWFANKSCPGPYIYDRLGQIAKDVNATIKASDSNDITTVNVVHTIKKAPFKVRIDTLNLNIRTGPGTNYAKTGKTTGKGCVTITEVKSGTGSSKGWGKLLSGAGWISLDYVIIL